MLDKKIVGENIADYRKRKELTQRELAEQLNITAQSVSKWEAGLSLPTVDILYDLASVLEVNVDSLLSDKATRNRDICYRDTGLDTDWLYNLKAELDDLVTEDEKLLHAHYIDPSIFQLDLSEYEEPVFSLITSVPGSKARMARDRGYDKEICADVVARSINHVLRMGLMPKILQAHVVCGNKESFQLKEMALSLKKTCEENGVIYAGMEIGCQPVNFRPNEYEISVALVGAADKQDLLESAKIQEGDVIIGLMTEGIEASSYPFIRVMLDRKPEMAYEKIDGKHYFIDEIMKPNSAFTHAIQELREAKILHGICRTENTIFFDGPYYNLPDGMGAALNLSDFPIKPLYRYLQGLDMIGKNFFPYRFGMGIGMMVIVPKRQADYAMKLIQKYHECHIIGRIENNESHQGKRVWTEGKMSW